MAVRIAVIGSGPSGISVLNAFAQNDNIVEVVCFEKQKDWGGQWNFSWRTGTDENGEPIHSSMYQHLWINSPKESVELEDYSFLEHFGRSVPSFLPREVMRDYILGRAENRNYRSLVRFNNVVRSVRFNQESQIFLLQAEDLTRENIYQESFNYVIVATGHYSYPKSLNVKGLDSFEGSVICAHDFRNAEPYRNQNVLLVGSGYTAEDLALQLHKFGAKSITVSYKHNPLPFMYPQNVTQKPLLKKIIGNRAYFKDKTTDVFDSIIICIGYIHHFPFLEDNLRFDSQINSYWINELYKGVVWINNPQLFYIGMQKQAISLPLFDAQAYYIRDIIMQRIQLPQIQEMIQDSSAWNNRMLDCKTRDDLINFQGDYILHIMNFTDVPKANIKGRCDILLRCFESKHDGLLNFRDLNYTSVVSGVKGTMNKTLWIEAFDESMDTFLVENQLLD